MTWRSCFAVAALFSAGCAGCSSVARVAVVPNVDTEGGAGVEARLTLGLGVTTMFNPERAEVDGEPLPRINMLELPQVSGVAGARLKGQTRGIVGVESALGYASIGRNPGMLGYRAAVFGGYAYDGVVGDRGTVGLSGALPWTVAHAASDVPVWSNARLTLGPVGEAAIIGYDKTGYGRFGLGLEFAAFEFTPWTVR